MLDPEVKVFHSEMARLFIELEKYANSASEVNAIRHHKSKHKKIRNDEITDDQAIKDIFWTEFEDFIEQCDPQTDISKKVVKKWAVPIVWGWWSWLHEDLPIPHGYSDKHVGMLQGPSNPSGRHLYKGRPKRIRWRLHPVMEGTKIRFFTATAPICEIDAVSSVPSIPNGVKIFDISKRILNPRIKAEQWQRGLDTSRIVNIKAFLDTPNNSFSNACMIFAPEHKSVDWELDSDGNPMYLLVDLQFLKQDLVKGAPYLTDNTGSKDLRPLNIIDGQHRVRGGMRSQRGANLQLPIVLFPPQLKNRGAAKYFAEVNTLAEPLNVLHELFMRHKFALGSHKPNRKFAKYDGTPKTYRDRANRLAYESAAFLNLNLIMDSDGEVEEIGALYFLIRMLGENTWEKNYVIAADMWVKYSYQWFMPKGPYPNLPISIEEEEMRKDDIFQEIANYFDAFMSVCNETKWPNKDTDDRWLTFESLMVKDVNRGRPYIQNNLTVRALLVNYPNIVKKIRDTGYSNTIITLDRFKKTLKIWGNIDWLDVRIKEAYHGSGEYPWKCLARWLKDAADRGEKKPHPIAEVMSEGISSERGKGILSPVEEGKIEFEDPRFKWPKSNDEIRIIVTRPINARRGCKIHLMDSNLKQLNQKANLKVVHSANPDQFTFEVKWWDGIDDYDELTVRSSWGNSIDKVVSSTLILRK